MRSGHPGIIAASLANPNQATRLLDAETNAVYARGRDGQGYLLWLRGETLVAQEFDSAALKLAGEARSVVEPVAGSAGLGQMNVAASETGALLFSASSTVSQFTWFDRAGHRLPALGDTADYSSFRLSPDGRRLVAMRGRPGGFDFWLLDVERGVASRFPGEFGSSAYPVWSPDGKTIVFRANSTRNMYRKDSSGTGPEERLTQSPNQQTPTDWSRDGRWILYYEMAPNSGSDLWALPVTPRG